MSSLMYYFLPFTYKRWSASLSSLCTLMVMSPCIHYKQEEVLVTAAFLLQLHLARLLHVSSESALVTFPHGLAWLEFQTGTDF